MWPTGWAWWDPRLSSPSTTSSNAIALNGCEVYAVYEPISGAHDHVLNALHMSSCIATGVPSAVRPLWAGSDHMVALGQRGPHWQIQRRRHSRGIPPVLGCLQGVLDEVHHAAGCV